MNYIKRSLLWFFFSIVYLYAIAQDHSNFLLPAPIIHEQIVNHKGYTLSYNENHEQANWVAYELTTEETNSHFKRTNRFMQDPLIATGSADNADYSKSGYDRGHLAPAADMGWSAQSMSESFYYSNMSPQQPSFNRGIWKRAEEFTRQAAIDNKAIYIVSGPVLAKNLPTIGHNQVAVPAYYFKVLLDNTLPQIKAIAFIIPNRSSQLSLQHYAVTINEVEKLTGIDFFPALPDDQEELLEGSIDLGQWFSVSPSFNNIKTLSNNKHSISTQCSGITKNAKRCKNKTKNLSGLCYLHQ